MGIENFKFSIYLKCRCPWAEIFFSIGSVTLDEKVTGKQFGRNLLLNCLKNILSKFNRSTGCNYVNKH